MTTKAANNKLTEARLNKLMSRNELARKAGVSSVTVAKAERGEVELRDYNQTRIARALGLKREDIFLI